MSQLFYNIAGKNVLQNQHQNSRARKKKKTTNKQTKKNQQQQQRENSDMATPTARAVSVLHRIIEHAYVYWIWLCDYNSCVIIYARTFNYAQSTKRKKVAHVGPKFTVFVWESDGK